ncbi:MAG: phosphatidate cytidylyltransferase [Alphaproteobacteria bacterium]
MAQPPPDRKPGNLRLRLLSALVFAPPVFAAIYVGSPWFDAIVVVAGLLMAWEWARICCDGEFATSVWLLAAAVGAAMAVTIAGAPHAGIAIVAAGGIVLLAVGRMERRDAAVNLSVGAVLIGCFAVSFLWIRDFPESGRELVIWLVLAVWFTDTGGYFFGRAIGGVKLAPRISPNKTWAGLGGGVLLASIWSGLWLTADGERPVVPAVAAGIAVAVIAQLGDLTVSAIKRRYGVKDASGLIPGHGGVLDRLDGMLLTAPTVAFVLFLSVRGWI